MLPTQKCPGVTEDRDSMLPSIKEANQATVKGTSGASCSVAPYAAGSFGSPLIRNWICSAPEAKHNCLQETLDWNKIYSLDFLRIAREVPVEELFECIITDKLYSKTGEQPWDLTDFVLQRRDRRMFIGGQGVVMFVRRKGHSTSLAMKVCYHKREEKKVERHIQRTILHLKGQSASQFVGTILVNYLTRRFFITVMPKAKFASLKSLKHDIITLPDKNIRYYFACIASALIKLHSIHICHRDIKCDNVLIMHNGAPALTDFGLAVKAPESMNEYKTNSRVTQMQYYPPETRQLGNIVNDYKIDCWLLGFFLCEMLFNDREHLWETFRISNTPNWIFATCPACLISNNERALEVLNQLLICDPKRRSFVADTTQLDYLKEDKFFERIESATPPTIESGEADVSLSMGPTSD